MIGVVFKIIGIELNNVIGSMDIKVFLVVFKWCCWLSLLVSGEIY